MRANYGLSIVGETPWVDTIKRALEREDSVEIWFRRVPDWQATRRELYNNFRGCDITIRKVGVDVHRVLILQEKIRTSDPILRLNPTESKAVVKMSDFFTVSRRCACCGEMKTEEHFGKRQYGKRIYRQAYCQDCQRLYGVWRGSFLRAHKADKLTPEYTIGHRQRNELFHIWYAAHINAAKEVK